MEWVLIHKLGCVYEGVWKTLRFLSVIVRALVWKHNSKYTDFEKFLYTDIAAGFIWGCKF